jgi:methylmalonyl-CoA mutase
MTDAAKPDPAQPAILPLADGFAPASADTWRALVEKVLKGADFDKRLVTRTVDGLAIQPLYTRATTAAATNAAPSATRQPRQSASWDIRQLHADHDPASINAAILEDLRGGVSSIHLRIAAPGWFGLDYQEASLARALDGVLLDVCPVALEAGEYTPDCAGSLLSIWRKAGLKAEQCHGAFNYDPLGTLAATGALYQPLDKAMAVAADLVRTTLPYPNVTALAADGNVWHAGGASEAEELACLFAAIVESLRACERAGITPADALPKIAVAVALDADQFLGIAKLRALRIGLARIADVTGAGAAIHRVPVNARTSLRMMTRRDPWVNMLRATIACTAGAMGGADSITVLPFTWALGRPDAFARRIARNTQIVLQEESGLGQVADPAGGSWAIKQITSDLANAAWHLFQQIEAEGGLGASLAAGKIQARLAATTAKRAADIARGKAELTGTSAFPRLGDDGVTAEPWPREILSADLPGARVTKLAATRLSEPFERLRDAADAAPTKPKIFLATLGPLASHATRATWTRNFLAAGGIDSVGDQPLLTSTDAGRAFADSGCAVVCLCAADATYAELAEATASLLKTAGAKRVYLAGKQKDEAPLRAAGVDDFIFAGADMIATLTRVHSDLGIRGNP